MRRRRVSSRLSGCHTKLPLCGAPKNLLNISTSAAVSAEENPPKKKKKKPGQQGLPGQQWELASCVYQMLISFSVFPFFCLFCLEKVKVLPAHCPFQCPLILAYYYHTSCSSPPLGTVSRPRCPFKRETERDTFFHSRDNRIELSSVSVDIERIVPRGERESYPCNFPLSLWSTTPTPTPT